MRRRGLPRRARGFEYPIPVPLNTAYTELDVDPAVSEQEVRWAVGEKIRSLTAERDKLRADLDKTAAKVEGFKEIEERAARLKRDGAKGPELAASERTLAQMERKALQANPKFLENRARCNQIDKEIHLWNQKALDRPDERLKYDRKNPPLALLKLSDCSRAAFTERRTALFLIRREVAAFLSSKGEPVFHPSDITRDDFRGDYQLNDLLDQPERLA